MIKIAQREFSERSEHETRIHGSVRACEVRSGERIAAELRWTHGSSVQTQRLNIWRVSPLGIELLGDGAAAEDLKTGKKVELRLTLGDQSVRAGGLSVENDHLEHGRRIIGVRWTPATQPMELGERRLGNRWQFTASPPPTGIIPNPLRFNDFIHFRITELARGGLQFVTSLRNNLLLPGLRLESVVTFPGWGPARIRLKLVHARVVDDHGTQRLSVGAQWLNPDRDSLLKVAQYLHQFGPPVTPEELRSAGFPLQSTLKAVELSYVRTAEDYRQVLALRKLAYGGAGKLPSDLPEEEAGDAFDGRSRIVIARYRGQVVGSLRLMFHGAADAMEHEKYVALPSEFPPREQTIEVTRVCTHPAFRRSDLLYGLFKHGMFICAQSGRRFIVGSSTPKLLKIYLRMGFELTAIRYRHEALGGEEHTVFTGDLHKALLGTAVNPLLWNALYSDVWNYVDPRHLPRLDSRARIRMRAYRLFGPVAQMLLTGLACPRRGGRP